MKQHCATDNKQTTGSVPLTNKKQHDWILSRPVPDWYRIANCNIAKLSRANQVQQGSRENRAGLVPEIHDFKLQRKPSSYLLGHFVFALA